MSVANGMELPTNLTTIVNTTDYFCVGMLVAPLVWGIFSVPCACVGVPASVWLLWVLVQRKRSGLSNDVYMLNLTVMDLIYNLSILPHASNHFIWHDGPMSMVGDAMFCFSVCGRPMLMVCICVDCYMAVVHPITYMKRKDRRYKVALCALVWSLTFTYGIVLEIKRELLSTPFITVPVVVSIPAIACLDAAILRALRKPDPSGRSDVHPQKQRALQTITNTLVMTLVSYLPPLVVYMFTPLMPLSPREILCHVLFPSTIPTMLGSTIMPLLYLGNLGKLTDLRRSGCTRGV